MLCPTAFGDASSLSSSPSSSSSVSSEWNACLATSTYNRFSTSITMAVSAVDLKSTLTRTIPSSENLQHKSIMFPYQMKTTKSFSYEMLYSVCTSICYHATMSHSTMNVWWVKNNHPTWIEETATAEYMWLQNKHQENSTLHTRMNPIQKACPIFYVNFHRSHLAVKLYSNKKNEIYAQFYVPTSKGGFSIYM